MHISVLVVSALLACFGGASALKCHICNNCSDVKPGGSTIQDCNDWCNARGWFILPLNGKEETGTKCPTGPFTSCRKIKQWSRNNVYHEGTAEETVIRTCGFSNETEAAYIYRTSDAVKSDIYNCFTDECNSASLEKLSTALFFATLFLGCFMW